MPVPDNTVVPRDPSVVPLPPSLGDAAGPATEDTGDVPQPTSNVADRGNVLVPSPSQEVPPHGPKPKPLVPKLPPLEAVTRDDVPVPGWNASPKYKSPPPGARTPCPRPTGEPLPVKSPPSANQGPLLSKAPSGGGCTRKHSVRPDRHERRVTTEAEGN